MSKIVGVHGVGQQFKGENILCAEWLPALKDGMARAGCSLVNDDDFSSAFYGDLFRPSGKSIMDPPYDASDVTDMWEKDMLQLWLQEVESLDTLAPGSRKRSKIRFSSVTQRALDFLSQSRFFAGIAERGLIYDLKQVRRYLQEKDVRHKVIGRVQRAIKKDTSVVIAHSLGSIVAYEALCANPELPVKVFITIGSPLGIRNLIFEALMPKPIEDMGVWPLNVEHWINIADKGDVVALVKKLSLRFGSGVVDHLVENGSQAHDATRYLTTRELGNAVKIGYE